MMFCSLSGVATRQCDWMGDPYSTPPMTTATCVTNSISGSGRTGKHFMGGLLGNEAAHCTRLDSREARESLQHICRLESEVSRRAEDDGLRLGQPHVYRGEHAEAERSRLARAVL